MDNFINIEIPYKSSLATVILTYSASFPNLNNFRCENIKFIDDSETLDLEVAFGNNKLDFKGNQIIIELKRIGDPVGLYFSADIYETLIIKIKLDNDTIDESNKKKDIITDFFKSAKDFCNKKNDKEIMCKILRKGGWMKLTTLPKRSLDTIYLPKKQKDNIFNDLKKFYDLKDEYIKLGIPWKRNYLLEGAPGTGKSSLIFALASELNLNIYIINLGPKVDDSVLMSAVAAIPKNTILLLEDIDALFIDRRPNDSNKSLVSFSGILNVLDGMARKSGLVTFLTTNYKEHLDKALIRPSRVDFILEFGKAEKKQINEMFNKFFPDRKSDFEKFYKKIDFLELRTCILQQFFMECKFNNKDIFNVKRIKEIINEMDNSKKVKGNLYI
jgi:hypothetical protein